MKKIELRYRSINAILIYDEGGPTKQGENLHLIVGVIE